MGDFIEYIISHRYHQYLSKLGLKELITYKHGTEGPGSTRSNKKKNAIDGIWGSTGSEKTFCGYIPVNHGIKSDHRMIWVRISLANALGKKTLPSKTPSSRKLRLHHPAGQKKYISKLRHINIQHNLLPRLRALENHQKCPPLLGAIKEYKKLTNS